MCANDKMKLMLTMNSYIKTQRKKLLAKPF